MTPPAEQPPQDPASDAAQRHRVTQAAWARTVVETLAREGVEHFVASPGSRNTPLLCALAQGSGYNVHSVVDERSAGFLALGLARAGAGPVALLCTSGSALAHYTPAVVEAATSSLPLIVVSADRPLELQECGAPQTIDQLRFFGAFARWFCDLGTPEPGELPLRALQRRVTQAVHTASSPTPGPVHLNFRARKPLEPPPDVPRFSVPSREIPSRFRLSPTEADTELIARACQDHADGVILCGPAAPSQAPSSTQIKELSERTGFPVYAEATSNLDPAVLSGRLMTRFDLFCRQESWRARARPRYVLQLGPAPVSAAWSRYVGAATDVRLHVVAPLGWPDPESRAEKILHADVDLLVAAVNARLAASDTQPSGNTAPSTATSGTASRRVPRDAHWCATHLALEENTLSMVQDSVTADPTGEGAAAQAVLSSLPAGTSLLVGNSLPLRLVDWFRARSVAPHNTFFQRGANGIDGLVAGALGLALGKPAPTVALLGDVTFLHDVGSLQLLSGTAAPPDTAAPFGTAVPLSTAASLNTDLFAGPRRSLWKHPLVIVVINNGGGRIFDHLPLAHDLPQEHVGLWRTQYSGSLAAIARGFGVSAEAVSVAELGAALQRALSKAGPQVIEVQVSPLPAAWFDRFA